MSEVIYFSNVRCSFPSLAAPYVSTKFPGSPPMFKMDIMDIDHNHPQVKAFMTRVADLATQTWKEHAGQILQMIQSDKRARCFGAGAEKINEQTLKPLDGYGQGFWITSKNKNRPQMIRPDGAVATTEMESAEIARRIYGGCYVNVAVKPWVRTANRGVSCDLVAVQFAKDGPAFGDAPADASGLFGTVAPQAGPAAAGAAMPGFMGGFAPAPAAPAMPAPPFGAPAPVGLPSFFGR